MDRYLKLNHIVTRGTLNSVKKQLYNKYTKEAYWKDAYFLRYLTRVGLLVIIKRANITGATSFKKDRLIDIILNKFPNSVEIAMNHNRCLSEYKTLEDLEKNESENVEREFMNTIEKCEDENKDEKDDKNDENKDEKDDKNDENDESKDEKDIISNLRKQLDKCIIDTTIQVSAGYELILQEMKLQYDIEISRLKRDHDNIVRLMSRPYVYVRHSILQELDVPCEICYSYFGKPEKGKEDPDKTYSDEKSVMICCCNKFFHDKCIDRWIAVSPNHDCPSCRYDLRCL